MILCSRCLSSVGFLNNFGYWGFTRPCSELFQSLVARKRFLVKLVQYLSLLLQTLASLVLLHAGTCGRSLHLQRRGAASYFVRSSQPDQRYGTPNI